MTRILVSLALASSVALGCGGSTGSSTRNPPADHTSTLGGIAHRPGYMSPETNCASCHGANLQGADGPSCTECHGQKW